MAAGYDDFDPEYDENGVCISGCAYKGIKLEDELAAIQRNTDAANARLAAYRATHPELTAPTVPTTPPAEPVVPVTPPVQTPPTVTPPVSIPPTIVPPIQTPPTTPPPVTTTPPGGTAPARECRYYSNTIQPGWAIPAQAPIDGDLVISSDFGTRVRPCSDCSANHRGIDLRAQTGTNVYAPADGVVTLVKTTARGCGQQIQITHTDGTISQYCHLSQQLVRQGDRIQGGCLIGKTGNTGSSTGPHLHYALMSAPQQFIDPLWRENRLGRSYRFKEGTAPSKEHQGKPLPGKIN